MAHNLETNGNDVAFALRGKPAWHNLANRIFNQDEDVTTQTMLEEAKLANWNVRLSPLTDHISESWNDVSITFVQSGSSRCITRTVHDAREIG